MITPKVYKANWIQYEGIYFSCEQGVIYSREMDDEEFVKLSEYKDLLTSYNELKFRMDGLEK